jgi:hypothetical protein
MFATAAIKRKQLIDLIRDEVPPFQERYWCAEGRLAFPNERRTGAPSVLAADFR